MKTNISLIIIAALFFFCFTKPAHAYLDPGTGSFIFQILIAGLVGGLYMIKTFWKNILGFFKKVFGRE